MDQQDHGFQRAHATAAPATPVEASRESAWPVPAEAAGVRRALSTDGSTLGPHDRGASTAATLLDLQRAAGNRAVVRLLQRQEGRARIGDTPKPARRPVVARHTAGATQAHDAAGVGVATTEAVAMEADDTAWIEEQLEAQGAGEEGATGAGGEGGEGEGAGEGEGSAAAPTADDQADDVAGLSVIVFDRGVALSGILADGDGTPVAARPLSDLAPEIGEGIAMAGVVSSEFSDAAFRSLKALGYIDLASGKVFPPTAELDISGFPPKGSGFSKQYRLKPTTTKDHSFKVLAAPAGTYDTGEVVTVTVGGQPVQLRKLVEVSEDVAAKTKRFEQEHVDDTVEAFNMSFGVAKETVNHFAGGENGEDPIYFRGNSEEEVRAYVEGRLTDYHNNKKLGGKPEDWVAAYKKLLALTISERDAKGTHSWSLKRSPKVDRAAGTVTYELNPPTATAGMSFSEITWDKV